MSSTKARTLLCCDWGTTSFRLRLVEADTLKTMAQTTEGDGILTTFRAWTASRRPDQARLAFYLAALQHHIASLERQAGLPLSGVPLVVAGMASASVGMIHLPYKKLPLAVDGSDLEILALAASNEFNHPLAIVSGACTGDDVLRGEETLVVGALANRLDGADEWLVVVPGTHSKHVTVRHRRAVTFATYMTGEFFALLSQQSILSQTMAAGVGLDQADQRDSFIRGVSDGARGNLLHDCFSIRYRHLLGQATPLSNYYRLSGLLIGAELNELGTRKPPAIMLVSGAELLPFYDTALRALWPTVRVACCDADDALLRGQRIIAMRAGLLPPELIPPQGRIVADYPSSHVSS